MSARCVDFSVEAERKEALEQIKAHGGTISEMGHNCNTRESRSRLLLDVRVADSDTLDQIVAKLGTAQRAPSQIAEAGRISGLDRATAQVPSSRLRIALSASCFTISIEAEASPTL